MCPPKPLRGERAKLRQLWDSVVREHFWAFPLIGRASLDTVHMTLSELWSPYQWNRDAPSLGGGCVVGLLE